ncbi:M15 family metallopeptidase [Chitinophaga sp. GCM10012297]|uniref:D-alanyl-D-alanine dipeptidase n=1 Tax=Chitinophaga chungangae TaxID=2821488 RepID=A0ABS3YL00_9BACT|nr:M15 family metallopeptidase [Chitinophaga chungangae]MBO9155368.1 M15 family metallopeptidase [Chitinophaga chungangae]
MKNIFILCFFLLPFSIFGQQIPLNKYGLPVVNNLELYQELVKADPQQALLRVTDFAMDVRYATADNFTKTVLYPFPAVFLRRPAYEALLNLQEYLAPLGLGIKIYDGYRPYRVTEKMWEIVPDDRYAADPKKGSGHNRGVAVDLTLIYLKTGKEMPMPTPYDDFTEKAHHDYEELSDEVKENRALLRTLMEAHGFVALETEWWHYYLKEPQKYPLMDIGFEELK